MSRNPKNYFSYFSNVKYYYYFQHVIHIRASFLGQNGILKHFVLFITYHLMCFTFFIYTSFQWSSFSIVFTSHIMNRRTIIIVQLSRVIVVVKMTKNVGQKVKII